MLREFVDVAGSDLGALWQVTRAALVGSIGGDEVFGEMVKYGAEAVVFVESWKSTSGKLLRLG